MIHTRPSDYLALSEVNFLGWGGKTGEPFSSMRALKPAAARRVWDLALHHSPGSRDIDDWKRHLNGACYIEENSLGDEHKDVRLRGLLYTLFSGSHEEVFLVYQPDCVFLLPLRVYLSNWQEVEWGGGYFALTRDEQVLMSREHGSFRIGRVRETYEIGGLYATPNTDGSFSVVKMLNVDSMGVHIAAYGNKWKSLAEIREEELAISVLGDGPMEQLSAEHLPLSRASFQAWKPIFLYRSTVTDEELDGYRMWLEAGGGYF